MAQENLGVVIMFDIQGMTSDTYRKVLSRLDAAGAGAPAGRQYHCAYGEPDNLQVIDFWDSVESFQAFGATLVPILKEYGVSSTPNIKPVRNQIMPPHG
jgi:hypothetical protein